MVMKDILNNYFYSKEFELMAFALSRIVRDNF